MRPGNEKCGPLKSTCTVYLNYPYAYVFKLPVDLFPMDANPGDWRQWGGGLDRRGLVDRKMSENFGLGDWGRWGYADIPFTPFLRTP